MPYIGAFTNSVSGINANSVWTNTISQNIANIETIGYKRAEVDFRSVVTSDNNGKVDDVLSGVDTQIRNRIASEGQTIATSNPFDATIEGDGFFVTRTEREGGVVELTQAGRFQAVTEIVDGTEQAFLRDIKGNYLLGAPFNVNAGTGGDISNIAALEPVRVDPSVVTFNGIATNNINAALLLNANQEVGSAFSFDASVFDGTGATDGVNDARRINFALTSTSITPVGGTFDFAVSTPNGTITASPAELTFGPDGRLTSGNNITLTANFTNPATTQTINVNLAGTLFADTGGANNRISSVTNLSVDGLPPADASNFGFGNNGVITAEFSTFTTREIYRIPSGQVNSPEQLELIDGTHFGITGQSGDIRLIDTLNTGTDNFVAGAVEASNTTLSTQFSGLIQAQRSFQFNSQTFSAINELIQVATNLK